MPSTWTATAGATSGTPFPTRSPSSANLLRKNGWQAGKTWGYEVSLPDGKKFPNGSMSLSKWQAIGVTRANGKPFKNGGDSAELKLPDGRGGPTFLMTKNFRVIKAYNNADKYALAVGLLADEIAGYGGLVNDWSRPFTKLSFDEKQELQKRLTTLGYYDGKVDGRIGEGSKAAIRAFQAQAGLDAGWPSQQGSPDIAQGALGGEQVQARTPSPGRLTQAGIVALVLVLLASGFAIVSWPSVAQEQNVRVRALCLIRAGCWTFSFAAAATTSGSRRP